MARDINLVEIDCPLCGSSRSKYLYPAKDYVFRVTEEEFGVRRCLDCSCGYLSPRPALQNIGKYYPTEYYWSYEQTGRPMSWDDLVRSRQKQLSVKARWLADMPPGKLLDIGAQKGEFLWAMQLHGWQVEGVEIDASVPNTAEMPIRYGDFLSLDFQPKSFDCITMWAVLEHVYDPASFVRKVATLLKPGGRFVALVTNFNSIQGRFFHADDYPRHLTYFTKESARRLCNRYGLALDKLDTRQEIFGGALNGGLVYGFKRAFGYSVDEVMYEWKNIREPDSFCCEWKGRPNWLIHNLSRADRLLSMPLEFLFDRVGLGLNMTFTATKSLDAAGTN